MSDYISGKYYDKVYVPSGMDFKKSILWMANYFKVVKNIFPEIYKYKNKKILEVGSAHCGFIEILNRKGFKHVTASDVSERLRPKEIKNKYIYVDLENCRIKNEYDLIFCLGVMEHINNSEEAVKAIFRMLKKDGVFIFSVPYPMKKHLFDPYHTNMQYPSFYTNLFYRYHFKLLALQDISIVPYLWRLGLPWYIKRIIENKLVISDTFFIFKKRLKKIETVYNQLP